MKQRVYNISLAVGLGLFALGSMLLHLAAGLVATGLLIIALTLHGARISVKPGDAQQGGGD